MVFRPITAVWLLAVPIMDTIAVIISRIRVNKSPFKPGRDHIHHQLLQAGFSQKKVLGILFTVAVLMAGIGVIGEIKEVPESIMFYCIVALFILYYVGFNYNKRILQKIHPKSKYNS